MLLAEQVRRTDDFVVVDRQNVDDRPATESLDEPVVGKGPARFLPRPPEIVPAAQNHLPEPGRIDRPLALGDG